MGSGRTADLDELRRTTMGMKHERRTFSSRIFILLNYRMFYSEECSIPVWLFLAIRKYSYFSSSYAANSMDHRQGLIVSPDPSQKPDS